MTHLRETIANMKTLAVALLTLAVLQLVLSHPQREDSSPPVNCGENELYYGRRTCAPICNDEVCKKPSKEPIPCLTICYQGCFCKEGYGRNSRNETCVKCE